MRVPFQDLSRQHNSVGAELDEAFGRVRRSEWYILGPEVEAFEEEFARYIGVKHAVGVANGTEAIQIALLALGIETGKEVITTGNTAVPTATAIRSAGMVPVFSEIGEKDWNLDPSELGSAMTPRTAAIIPVHLYGNPARMDAVIEFANNQNLFVVEDCAQAHGAEINGKKAGSHGNIAAFSFYPSKNLGALGDGGMLTTDDRDLYDRCKLVRNYGQSERNRHMTWGINSRLDDIQAAFLCVKLKRLDEWNRMRRRAAEMYARLLENTPVNIQQSNGKNVFHLMVIRLPENVKRESFIGFLAENGISTAIHYPMPIYRQESYKDSAPRMPLPLTERHCRSVVSLPIFPFITDEEIEYTCAIIKKFFERG